MTLTANPDGLQPSLGCVKMTPAQRLKVVNNTNGFGQGGETITMTLIGLPRLTIPRGTSATYPQPIGAYLAPGQHHGTCSCEPGSSFDIWVVPS